MSTLTMAFATEIPSLLALPVEGTGLRAAPRVVTGAVAAVVTGEAARVVAVAPVVVGAAARVVVTPGRGAAVDGGDAAVVAVGPGAAVVGGGGPAAGFVVVVVVVVGTGRGARVSAGGLKRTSKGSAEVRGSPAPGCSPGTSITEISPCLSASSGVRSPVHFVPALKRATNAVQSAFGASLIGPGDFACHGSPVRQALIAAMSCPCPPASVSSIEALVTPFSSETRSAATLIGASGASATANPP